MRRTTLTVPREASRTKVGLSVLACVIAALTVAQAAATRPGHLVIASREISR